MQRLDSGDIRFSPGDLNTFLRSPFASWMDRYHLERPGEFTPDEPSEEALLIMRTGLAHERQVLRSLLGEGGTLPAADIRRPDWFATEFEFLYQVPLHAGPFGGVADFVVREPDGKLAVYDAKLARSVHADHLLQLLCYADLLEQLTGREEAATFGLYLGDGSVERIRRADFDAYYRHVRDRFLEFHRGFRPRVSDRPEPAPHADHGKWASLAERILRAQDHLNFVANITSGQVKLLEENGITTLRQLATATTPGPGGMGQDVFERLRHQAQLQIQTNERRRHDAFASAAFESLPTPAEAPRNVLPPPDPADIFFDMEGFPLEEGGLEYLFGACTRDLTDARPTFHDWWAHNRHEERAAFERFVDWAHARWKANPSLHIYHYAAYEVSALRRLSTRHDTRTELLDELLRAEVFVDLYKVVRAGLRIGTEGYSIKDIEHLYRGERTAQVSTSVGSVVQYAYWRETQDPEVLREIREYNREDCESTLQLEEWLRTYLPTVETEPPSEEPRPKSGNEELADQLRESTDPALVTLGDLVEFHSREAKPSYWLRFDRASTPDEELWDDPGVIVAAVAVGNPIPEKRSLIQEYNFPVGQEIRLASTRVAFRDSPLVTAEVVKRDEERGQVFVKMSLDALAKIGGSFPPQTNLLEDDLVGAKPIPEAIARIGTEALSGNLRPVARALLERRPALPDMPSADDPPLDRCLAVLPRMNHGCLVVQGPPGTGKTYTASRLIHHLTRAGKRVGVMANTHNAIDNVLQKVHELAPDLSIFKQGSAVPGVDSIRYAETGKIAPQFVREDGGKVIGGTAWLFANAAMQDQLDYLFVDEAGQVALANAVAATSSTSNLVLLGDQMQLEQPIKGSHPGFAGHSVLQYLLMAPETSTPDNPIVQAVVPADFGVFLAESFRMHPSLCNVVSSIAYEDRLRAHASCGTQSILDAPKGFLPHGLQFVPVEHIGNVQSSPEEVVEIGRIVRSLLGRRYRDKRGRERPLTLEDFVIISPYNAQVKALAQALPNGARVGTVDRFQGQEAPISILTLSCSPGEYGSRGLSFVLSLNRLNVAISRAECLAIVVGAPGIADTAAKSVREMRLLSLFCRLREVSES